MNYFRRFFLTIILAAMALVANANVTDLPVKTINGKKYYYYEVQPKETLYSLQHKLNVDRETIIKYNPSVEDGLRAYEVLYFPVANFGTTKSGSTAGQATAADKTHKVTKGETIYGISRQYGLTTDELIALNPSLKDGLKTGQEIIVSKGAKKAATPVQTAPTKPQTPSVPKGNVKEATVHEILPGESLYSIARNHNVTIEEILAVNPGLDPNYYQSGQIIYIPSAGSVTAPAHDTGAVNHQAQVTEIEVVEDTPNDLAHVTKPAGHNTVSIAVILPFMLNEKNISKNAARYTEFYRGLLLAVNEKKEPGKPIRIYAYDTSANIDSVKKILTRSELKDVNAIIAPPDEAHFSLVSRFGRSNDIPVINPFIIKETSQHTNSAVMQANIPGTDMQAKAVSNIARRFGDRQLVVIRSSKGPDEHSDFVSLLKDEFISNGASPVTITYQDKMTKELLSRLPASPEGYLFIPVTGKQNELNKILPALVELKGTLGNEKVMLLGFPEWITYRGDTRNLMSKVDTIIYSRFFSNDKDPETERIDNSFKFWYGEAPSDALPKQGYLGLDLGSFLIDALRANGGDFEESSPTKHGIQNGYHFVKLNNDSGWTNDVMYLIEYRPTGIVNRIEL